MKPTELLLQCTDLTKSFPITHGRTEVLKEVRFTVHSGTVNLITGPSGAGKTTQLGLIATLARP
jgi:ABC-type multidrug transport system ATPase subunit